MPIAAISRLLSFSVLLLSIGLYAVITPAFAQVTTTESGAEIATDEPLEIGPTPYPIEQLLGDEVIGDFVLGPGKVELEIAPGETKTVEITVSNRIGETKAFSLDVEDMTGSTDPARSVVLLGDDTGPYTLRDYISIPQKKFELDHNLRTRVPVTISVPPDAEPGGRYGSVLVKTVTREAELGDVSGGTAPASAIVSRIGTLFFLTISGETNRSGALKEFSTHLDKTWFDAGPIDFEITYENTGSVHVNPYGEIRITNMSGAEVGFVELEPWFVLPSAIRLREVSWDRDLLYGRYTATIKLNRGYDDVIDEQTITFWVIPWKLVGGGLVGIFIIFLLLRGFFRTFEFKRKGS